MMRTESGTQQAGRGRVADSSAATPVAGDPLGESNVLIAIQSSYAGAPQAERVIQSTARGLSHFGEHALGWMGLAAGGSAVARASGKGTRRQREWVAVGVSAFVAHAISVILKRIVRRPRPHDPRIRIGVGTPSKLSFPSSHATSSTAALVALSDLSGSKTPLLGVPTMALSRLVLGVHYPSDVAIGSLIGALSAKAIRALMVPEK